MRRVASAFALVMLVAAIAMHAQARPSSATLPLFLYAAVGPELSTYAVHAAEGSLRKTSSA